MITSNQNSYTTVEVQDENLLLIVVFDFLDSKKTPEEKVATN